MKGRLVKESRIRYHMECMNLAAATHLQRDDLKPYLPRDIEALLSDLLD
jgi:hypothetical protein